jgi:hypothetical protein
LRAGLGTLVSAAYLLSIAAQAAPSRTEVHSVETDAARPIKLSDVAMASGGLFIGATRRGADGFGFGGARRTDEFEPAQVRGRATPSEARSGAYLMQNSGAKGRFGSGPDTCIADAPDRSIC